eukprot:4197189-Lingulodinium_polyedra.AAC.1
MWRRLRAPRSHFRKRRSGGDAAKQLLSGRLRVRHERVRRQVRAGAQGKRRQAVLREWTDWE